jgi:IclR family transcriptional regulator, pca regulon regulatory protein
MNRDIPSESLVADGDPNFMTSLARGLAVIAGFPVDQQRMTIAQLSQRTGISRAAVRRCLYTLSRLGYVGSDDRRTYSLRPKLLGLGRQYLAATPLVLSAQPLLDRLSEQTGESSSLGVLDGDKLIYVARGVGSRVLAVHLNVGNTLPAYCTSIGQVLLAGLSDTELDAYINRLDLRQYTERTPVTPDALRAALANVRTQGYALADRLMDDTVCSVAVPVRDATGRTVAGMNLLVKADAVSNDQLLNAYLPPLASAARELGSSKLGA